MQQPWCEETECDHARLAVGRSGPFVDASTKWTAEKDTAMRLMMKFVPMLAVALPVAMSGSVGAQPGAAANHAMPPPAANKAGGACAPTTSYPDGHSVMVTADGTVTTTFADKHAATTTPDGRTITTFPDGTRTVTSPDQLSVTTGADGRVKAIATDPKKIKEMGGKMKKMGGKLKEMGGSMKQPELPPSKKMEMGGVMMDMSNDMMEMGGSMSGDTTKPADKHPSDTSPTPATPPAPPMDGDM